jgi:transposase
MAVANSGDAPAEFLKTITYDCHRLLKELRKSAKLSDLRVCYEAGPTGFGLRRFLAGKNVSCIVAAPSLVPVQTGSRVKSR